MRSQPSRTFLARIPALLKQKQRRVEQAQTKLAHYRSLPLTRETKRCITLWEGRLRYAQKEIVELQQMQQRG